MDRTSQSRRGTEGKGIRVRTVIVPLLGFAWGVMAGLVLSEVVGIVGFLLFDRAVGIRFLPIYLAVERRYFASTGGS
jgi:hypothetical protein